MNKVKLTALTFVALSLAACSDTQPTSDQVDARRQERLSSESSAQVGVPGVNKFTEKKIVKKLYEVRDNNISTFTYVLDMQGRLWHVCDSVGFGLPYGVQFTNPEKHVDNFSSNTGGYNIPQAEPNGLYMPPTAEGTWVMCAAPGGNIDPLYVEPKVVSSTHKLKSVGSWQF